MRTTPFGSLPTLTGRPTRTGRPLTILNRLTLSLSGFATASTEPSALRARGCDDVGPVNRATAADGRWYPPNAASNPAPMTVAAFHDVLGMAISRICRSVKEPGYP